MLPKFHPFTHRQLLPIIINHWPLSSTTASLLRIAPPPSQGCCRAVADVLRCVALCLCQVLASFQEQLLSLNSEKEQRGLIKTLLAESGAGVRGGVGWLCVGCASLGCLGGGSLCRVQVC